MNDNPDAQLEALFRAARAPASDTGRLEFAFETRVLARLREERHASLFVWAWKLCPLFAAMVLAAALWTYTSGAANAADANVIAEIAGEDDEHALMAYMTGARR